MDQLARPGLEHGFGSCGQSSVGVCAVNLWPGAIWLDCVQNVDFKFGLDQSSAASGRG